MRRHAFCFGVLTPMRSRASAGFPTFRCMVAISARSSSRQSTAGETTHSFCRKLKSCNGQCRLDFRGFFGRQAAGLSRAPTPPGTLAALWSRCVPGGTPAARAQAAFGRLRRRPRPFGPPMLLLFLGIESAAPCSSPAALAWDCCRMAHCRCRYSRQRHRKRPARRRTKNCRLTSAFGRGRMLQHDLWQMVPCVFDCNAIAGRPSADLLGDVPCDVFESPLARTDLSARGDTRADRCQRERKR